MNKKIFVCIAAAVLCCGFRSYSQGQPIGYWRAHMPYNNAISAATDGVTVFAASDESFFTYNAANDELSTYSKVEGMADVGMAYLAYDATTDYAILAYTNGNIDLFKDETFYNIPDIKLKNITGLKKINHIYAENGTAYISTSFGIVVLNLIKKETKETYTFISNGINIEIKEFSGAGNYFYAATANGLYRANKNSPNLQAFASWQKLSGRPLNSITTVNNNIFTSTADSVFSLANDTLAFVYKTPYKINSIDSAKDGIWVNEDIAAQFTGKVKHITENHQVIDSFKTRGKPVKTLTLSDQSVWVADALNGLCKRNSGDDLKFYQPGGPASNTSFDLLPYNGELWIAHGGYDDNWTYKYGRSGLSHFKDNKWTIYNWNTTQLFYDEDITDMDVLARDPVNGTIYAGAYRSGLFIVKPDGSYEYYREGTSFLEPTQGDPSAYRVSGITFDQNNNLWLTQAGAIHELAVKTPEGNWYKYSGAASSVYAASIVTDDYNQKWYIMPGGLAGVAVYNDNYTPDNPNDDIYAKFSTSNISAFVNCIVSDKQSAIWFGTNDGIGVLNCSPDQIASGTCQIDRPIVQYDQFAGYLFQNEKIKSIAVDGANRKWIGTMNGVWLISPDGDKIINRFTAENSPLPSNAIQKIAIDPITGDVYIGTAAGLVSYRSTATEGIESVQNVITFPNPVPSGYTGTIAIKGVPENADVRITDISGQLIYRTKALGGQAVWSGKDYTGRRPQSGVYLIFITNKDGSQTHAGKMVFME